MFFNGLAKCLSETPLWNTYASVRLDMKDGDNVHYFKDVNSFNLSLYSNPPDPSLGYMDNTTGSDMFSVIRYFLKNTEYLCGSTIVIAAKRYPNDVDIEDLISDLQKNHVFVYILSTDTPSGGSNPSAMSNVAIRTNGYCVFSPDGYLIDMYDNSIPLATSPGQIVASKFAVLGKGSLIVPFKTVKGPSYLYHVNFEIVYQDHKKDGSMVSLNYTITDDFGNNWLSAVENYFIYTGYENSFDVNNEVQYYLKIDYEYQEGRQEVLLVRMYAYDYIPNSWLPFNN